MLDDEEIEYNGQKEENDEEEGDGEDEDRDEDEDEDRFSDSLETHKIKPIPNYSSFFIFSPKNRLDTLVDHLIKEMTSLIIVIFYLGYASFVTKLSATVYLVISY